MKRRWLETPKSRLHISEVDATYLGSLWDHWLPVSRTTISLGTPGLLQSPARTECTCKGSTLMCRILQGEHDMLLITWGILVLAGHEDCNVCLFCVWKLRLGVQRNFLSPGPPYHHTHASKPNSNVEHQVHPQVTCHNPAAYIRYSHSCTSRHPLAWGVRTWNYPQRYYSENSGM